MVAPAAGQNLYCTGILHLNLSVGVRYAFALQTRPRPFHVLVKRDSSASDVLLASIA